MATTMVIPKVTQPQSPTQAGVAVANPARDNRYRTMQIVLFTVGAVLMPAGIVAIILGWYGVAHTKYQYDQLPYVVSGGLLGLGLISIGGFLYFGAWLAKVANDQREGSRQLADTILVLADLVSRQAAARPVAGLPAEPLADPGAVPVLAGGGSTAHRRDCPLIAHRDDLHVLTGQEAELATCRVCRPTLV